MTNESERPLHDYIDMEAYDVVSGERHRELREEVERLRRFCERADEYARLIAEASGADGTSPDDWRALLHKWDFALESVRDLRIDYDEAIGIEKPREGADES